MAIFESAETVHLILLYYLGDAVRYAVSAASKMAARNRPLGQLYQGQFLRRQLSVRLLQRTPFSFWSAFIKGHVQMQLLKAFILSKGHTL